MVSQVWTLVRSNTYCGHACKQNNSDICRCLQAQALSRHHLSLQFAALVGNLHGGVAPCCTECHDPWRGWLQFRWGGRVQWQLCPCHPRCQAQAFISSSVRTHRPQQHSAVRNGVDSGLQPNSVDVLRGLLVRKLPIQFQAYIPIRWSFGPFMEWFITRSQLSLHKLQWYNNPG
jgi:hypothetical protein